MKARAPIDAVQVVDTLEAAGFAVTVEPVNGRDRVVIRARRTSAEPSRAIASVRARQNYAAQWAYGRIKQAGRAAAAMQIAAELDRRASVETRGAAARYRLPGHAHFRRIARAWRAFRVSRMFARLPR